MKNKEHIEFNLDNLTCVAYVNMSQFPLHRFFFKINCTSYTIVFPVDIHIIYTCKVLVES